MKKQMTRVCIGTTFFLALGIPVGELRPDSQLYFDYHHTRNDTLEHVNPRSGLIK